MLLNVTLRQGKQIALSATFRTKLKNTYLKLIDIFTQPFKAKGIGAGVDIGPAGNFPMQPENELETGRLEEVYDKIPLNLPPSIETAKGSIHENDLKTAR